MKPRSPPEKHRFTRDGTSSCQSLGIRNIFFTSQRNNTCKVFPHPTEHLTHCWFEKRPLYDAKYLHKRFVHEHVRRWRQDDRSTHPPNAHGWGSATEHPELYGTRFWQDTHGAPVPAKKCRGWPTERCTRDTATRKSRFNTTPGLPTIKNTTFLRASFSTFSHVLPKFPDVKSYPKQLNVCHFAQNSIPKVLNRA